MNAFLAVLAAAPFVWALVGLLALLISAALRGIRNHCSPEES